MPDTSLSISHIHVSSCIPYNDRSVLSTCPFHRWWHRGPERPLVQSHPPQLLLWEQGVNLAALRGGLHGMTHVELLAHALREPA